MSEHLPPRFAELERELDRIARRMLDEQLESDPLGAASRVDVSLDAGSLDHAAQEPEDHRAGEAN